MYKKILIILIAIIFSFSIGCKQGKQKENDDKKTAAKKEAKEKKNIVYAKYRVNIYKDKNLNKWMATLAKGEKVTLLKEFSHKVNNNKVKLAYIVRADGETKGYLERRHLAGKPIIIAENEAEVYDQPTVTSNLFVKVSKGKVGFILDKKGKWTQIYIGYVKKDGNKKYVNEKWIKGGFSTDLDQIKNGLLYQRAVDKLEDDDGSNDKDAIETLETISEKQTLVSSLAEKKLLKYEEPTLE